MTHRPHRQHGLATLFVVVTLLAIAALVVLASSRHLLLAQFNAQNQHRYHQALDNAETGLAAAIANLSAGKSLPPPSALYTVTVQDLGEGKQRLISAGHHDDETVSVQRLLSLSPAPPSKDDNAINIMGDLNLGGAIKITGNPDAVLNVDGNVTLGGSVSGISTLNATGSITLKGNQQLDVLHANGDIQAANGQYQTIKSKGSVTLTGNAAAAVVLADGKGNFGNASVDSARLRGDVDINGGNTTVGSLATRGKLSSRSSNKVGPAQVMGDLSVSGWGGPLTATIGGQASYNTANKDIRVTRQPGLSIDIKEVEPVSIGRPVINALDYRALANYAFSADQSGHIRVAVRQVAGLEDGDYYLAGDAKGRRNLLCQKLDAQGRCATGPSEPLCKGYSDYNDCLTVQGRNWALAGVGMAPGLLWFDGNLKAGNGTYYNALIATGDIETSGDHTVYAVNYIGYQKVCRNEQFPNLTPLNLCDTTTGKLRLTTAGNIALLAGSASEGRFQGGDIRLGSSNHVYGNVLAGKQLISGGSSTVHGYITVAGQGLNGMMNQWSGSTTIDLSDLPESFQPGGGGSSGGGNGGKPTIRLLPHSWIDSGAGAQS